MLVDGPEGYARHPGKASPRYENGTPDGRRFLSEGGDRISCGGEALANAQKREDDRLRDVKSVAEEIKSQIRGRYLSRERGANRIGKFGTVLFTFQGFPKLTINIGLVTLSPRISP